MRGVLPFVPDGLLEPRSSMELVAQHLSHSGVLVSLACRRYRYSLAHALTTDTGQVIQHRRLWLIETTRREIGRSIGPTERPTTGSTSELLCAPQYLRESSPKDVNQRFENDRL